MILLDANILLYAYVEELPQHRQTAKWMENILSDQTESIAIAWIAAAAFLRIASNKRIFKRPWSIAEASERLDEVLAHQMVQTVGPTARHWSIYSKILKDMNLSGDIVMDAHITAIAVEHKAAVASVDKDFRRFSDYVKIINPLAG